MRNNENKLLVEDASVHRWYRFVLSFPPHLVRTYLNKFGVDSTQIVLDPFCGTGTTLVECKKNGIESVGIEANPFAHFASTVKVNWDGDPKGLFYHAKEVAEASKVTDELCSNDEILKLKMLPDDSSRLLLKNSISPLPLHRTLILSDALKGNLNNKYYDYERLALANALVNEIGNLHFGPEVGVRDIKEDAPVIESWLSQVELMVSDLGTTKKNVDVCSRVYKGDARGVGTILEAASIDAVITSPPYPNEKDYTRTSRLESVILNFINNKKDLRAVKQNFVRSNTRSVFSSDLDHAWVADNAEVHAIAAAIEKRRIQLNKTSGFERLYPKLTLLYFGGMTRHLADLRKVLKPGAHLAYVVGDQASYLQVMIRTGQLLSHIAESLGYKVEDLELFRTRYATATKQELREEVLILKWPGSKAK